jgi:hypothetical protein
MAPSQKENMLKNNFRLSRRSVDRLMANQNASTGDITAHLNEMSFKNLLSSNQLQDRIVKGLNTNRNSNSVTFSMDKENSKNMQNLRSNGSTARFKTSRNNSSIVKKRINL